MAARLLPKTLPELYAHAIVLERDAAKRFQVFARCMRDSGMDHLAEELDLIGKEEREQYEVLVAGTADANLPAVSSWEYAWHFMGPAGDVVPAPSSVRDVLKLAISAERRTQNFYADVAENVEDEAVSAFAADMAVDESRHIERLERLLAREPEPVALEDEELLVPEAPTSAR
jgi:rubrerythrin